MPPPFGLSFRLVYLSVRFFVFLLQGLLLPSPPSVPIASLKKPPKCGGIVRSDVLVFISSVYFRVLGCSRKKWYFTSGCVNVFLPIHHWHFRLASLAKAAELSWYCTFGNMVFRYLLYHCRFRLPLQAKAAELSWYRTFKILCNAIFDLKNLPPQNRGSFGDSTFYFLLNQPPQNRGIVLSGVFAYLS